MVLRPKRTSLRQRIPAADALCADFLAQLLEVRTAKHACRSKPHITHHQPCLLTILVVALHFPPGSDNTQFMGWQGLELFFLAVKMDC